jgi:aldehyde:ferredoxin oxidoreductase
MKGYRGTVLRINLSDGSLKKEPFPESLIEEWIGGKGIGTLLQYREIPPHVEPLSPQNKIIIVAGPGAGTIIPTATRLGLYTRSPLNGLCVDSYVGGSFGQFMKRAGYDIFIVEGKSPQPVWIRIIDTEVTLEDAGWLWGKNIYESEDLLKERLGESARVLTIGPAGENLVRYACIANDYHRHFGRMGSGAVMGSKLLKAIALVGSGEVEVWDPDGLKEYVRDLNRRIRNNPSTGVVYPQAGTPSFVRGGNELGAFPGHYWHRGQAEYKEKLDFEYMRENTLVKQTRCFGCPIGCAHINRIPDGPYEGVEIDGPEYETIYAFGGLCDLKDIREVIALNDLCDREGIDTITTGNVLGLLMDATERGRVPSRFQIGFGDTERMMDFIKKIVEAENEWQVFGEGTKRIAECFGLEDLAIHVKGLEPAGFDPRGLQSMAVTYGVGNRGASHLTSNAYARDIAGKARDHEIGGRDKKLDRLSLHNKAELVYNMINFNVIADCFILCRFLNRDLLTWDDYSQMLYLLTGVEKKEEELEQIANKIVTLGRLRNLELGLSSDDDLLPERFYSEPIGRMDADKTAVSREAYKEEIHTYYRLRGWNERGEPLSNMKDKVE